MPRRSPLKLRCDWLIPQEDAIKDIRVYGGDPTSRKKSVAAKAREEFRPCRWACVGPVRAARFSDRSAAAYEAILHPSTKAAGRWQVSFFDDRGAPWSDSEGATCDEVAALLSPRVWRLREVS